MEQKSKQIYIYLGTVIPVGFLLLFLILNFLGNFTAPPQNDVIFVKENYGLEFSIKNNNIHIQQKKKENVKKLPEIIRFNQTKKHITKYKIIEQKQNGTMSYSVPSFPQNIKINHNKISKDGYRFVCSSTNRFFFFTNNQDNNCVLHKWVKNIPIKESNNYHSLFLGWIENE